MQRASIFRLILILGLSLACNFSTALPGEPTALPPQPTEAVLQSTIDPADNGGVDDLVNSLPQWSDVSPDALENNGAPTGETAVAGETTGSDNNLYTCTTTPYSITKNPQEIAIHNPDAAVLWPGALIRGRSHLQTGSLELLAVSGDKRAPLGISIQGGGVLGIPGGVSAVVEQPVGSAIREGINQIVVNTLGADVAVGAGASSFNSVESHSSSQALLNLGLDARYLGAAASGRLNYSRAANEYTYTAYFVQRLFTVVVDLPERPSSFFADNVTGADLQSLGISDDNLPLYIDSVSYGRILMFTFTSSDSRERIAAALEFSYNSPIGGVDGFAETELRQTLSTARIEIFALGGPNTGVQNLIRDGNLAAYFAAPLAINQVEPISFTIRNLNDNRLARVANTTDYEVRECQPVTAGLPQPIHWWTADGNTEATVGDVALSGDPGAYGAGWPNPSPDPNNRSFVFDGVQNYFTTLPAAPIVPTDGPFTVSAWINPRATAGHYTIISQVGSQYRAGDFALRVYGGEQLGRLQFWRRPSDGSGANDLVQSGLIVPRNAWSHVVAVYGSADGGGALQIYVNGNPVGGGVVSGNYGNCNGFGTVTRIASSELCANASGPALRRFAFNGSIDEVMVFDRALTAEEVQAMYQNFEQYKQ